MSAVHYVKKLVIFWFIKLLADSKKKSNGCTSRGPAIDRPTTRGIDVREEDRGWWSRITAISPAAMGAG